jgi:hypothetical protein
VLAVQCPVCRDARLVEISLNMRGSRVTLRSCSRCDNRWWDEDGELVPVDSVLDLARRPVAQPS